jgi:phosphoribosylcarboxyaminoimidazole (NCAIR) mutase
MRNLSIAVTVAGTIALIIAIVEALFNVPVLGVTPAGYLRGATALFLLALICIAYSGCCCCCKDDKKKK